MRKCTCFICLLIMLDILLLICPSCFAGSRIKFNARTTIDLEPCLGLKWRVTPVFCSNPSTIKYMFFEPGNGWLAFHEREARVWKQNAGVWKRQDRLMRQYGEVLNSSFFANSMNDCWFVLSSAIPYKQNLLHVKNNMCTTNYSPNTAQIRHLWFADKNNGWAACDWGQIMRYDGRAWQQQYCPVPGHVDLLHMFDAMNGVAVTDSPFRLLECKRGRWDVYPQQVVHNDNAVLYSIPLLQKWSGDNNDDHYYTHIPQSLIHGSVKTDTVNLMHVKGCNTVLFSHKQWTTVGYLRDAMLKGSKAASDHDIVYIKQCNSVCSGDTLAITYNLYTKIMLQRKLVLLFLPIDKPNDSVRFLSTVSSGAFEHGICISDLTNDGYEDRYVVVILGVNRLYTGNSKDRILKNDIGEKSGAGGPTKTDHIYAENYDEGVTSADIDNDGDQDLFVTSLYQHNFIFEQIHKGRFTETSKLRGITQSKIRSTTGIWGDVNNDGYIDLFVANQDSSNILYLNNGSGYFTDITVRAGLTTERGTWGPMFGDIDNDGDLDLFVPRRGLSNLLYINNYSGKNTEDISFTEQSRRRGVSGADSVAHSTSGTFADIDNDGDLDLYVTNLTCTNWLYLNDGTGHFTELTMRAGLIDTSMSQTAVFFDADNDGDLDLYDGNRGRSMFYMNMGDGSFSECTWEKHAEFWGYVSGLAAGDLNNDGIQEVYVSDDRKSGRRFYSNTDNQSIQIRVSGTVSNRDGIGTRIYMYESGHVRDNAFLQGMREISGGNGFNSMNSRTAHFGLAHAGPRDFYVVFPSGITRTYTGINSGPCYTFYEETGWQGKKSLIQKHIRRNIYSPPNRKVFSFACCCLLTLALVNVIFLRLVWWKWKYCLITFLVPAVILILMYTLVLPPHTSGRHIISAFITLVFFAVCFLVVQTVFRKPENRDEALEKLYFILTGFFHGEWGARKLNRIQLYCTNLEPGEPVSDVFAGKMDSAIDDYFSFVVPEIQKMAEWYKTACLPQSAYQRVTKNLLIITENLNTIKVGIKLNEANMGAVKEIIENITALKGDLERVRKRIEPYFSCTVASLVKNECDRRPDVLFSSDITDHVRVRMRPAEISQILDNLIENSRDAVKLTGNKQVFIHVKANIDFAVIHVTDYGCGILQDDKNKLFKEQFSTKKNGKGIGLHYSKQLLEKYGGDISLARSEPFLGTEFEIHLKRIDHG